MNDLDWFHITKVAKSFIVVNIRENTVNAIVGFWLRKENYSKKL